MKKVYATEMEVDPQDFDSPIDSHVQQYDDEDDDESSEDQLCQDDDY